MPNNPTDNKKRRPVDAWFWELFVQACGSKCCACGRPAPKLERGHIISHGDGGTDSLDNLIPVCPPCNKEYLKKPTPDNRPSGWCERFYLLVGHRLKPRIIMSHKDSLGYLIPVTNTTENKALVNWERGDFGAPSEVFTQSCNLTKDEAESLVRALVIESKSFEVKPHAPFEKRYTQMIVNGQRTTREVFMGAGRAFLDAEPWLPNVKGHDIDRDSWREFAEHFYIYETKWRAELKHEADERQRREAAVPEAAKVDDDEKARYEAWRKLFMEKKLAFIAWFHESLKKRKSGGDKEWDRTNFLFTALRNSQNDQHFGVMKREAEEFVAGLPMLKKKKKRAT